MDTLENTTLVFVCLERADFLAKSLASVKGAPNIVVVDNGTRNTHSKIKIKAAAMKAGARLVIMSENEGLPKAWNRGIIEAKTDWVALCPDDVVFREGWAESFKEICTAFAPKVVLGNNYDMILLHKSLIPQFGWLEERYKQYPSSEDYDYHLRLTEAIGFSPYTMPGDHIQGKEREVRMQRAKLSEEQYLSKPNFTFWCTSPWSKFDVFCDEIPHLKVANYFEKNESEETGYDFHKKKWEVCDEANDKALLNIDGQFWRRKMPDVDPYPKITEAYRKKYEGDEV